MPSIRAATVAALLVAAADLSVLADPVARRLTGVQDAYPHPSPDGRRVVFQSNRSGEWQLYVMNGDGTGVTPLTTGPGPNVSPKWSPDGRSIVFSSDRDGNPEVYVVRADGSGLRRLTDHSGDDSHPSWAADGSRIVFNSARTTPDLSADWGRQWHEAFTMAPDGSDLRQLTRCRAVCTYPALSPDGTRLAYRRVVEAPGMNWDLTVAARNSEVMVAAADGSGEINVSNSPAFDGWPAWAPDGRTLAFSSNRGGVVNMGQVFAVEADGRGLRAVTAGPESFVQPAWSGDGRRIFAAQHDREDTWGSVAVVEVASPR